MKKLLLLAITAVFGMNAFAQNEAMTEQPNGDVKSYDREGKTMFFQNPDDKKPTVIQSSEIAPLQVIFDADGKTVYFRDPVGKIADELSEMFGKEYHYWIKGEIAGDKITFPAKSAVFTQTNKDGSKTKLAVAYHAIKDNKLNVLDEPIVYTVNADKSQIILEDATSAKAKSPLEKFLAVAVYQSAKDEWGWFGTAEIGGTYTIDAAGIETIATEAGKQIASETYYDLSGRQIAKPANGVAIKNVKFTDGTTKSVKFIGK